MFQKAFDFAKAAETAELQVKEIHMPAADMVLLHHFLGVKVVQDQAKRSVWIGQPTYINALLERFGMENSKPVKTPVSCGSRLVKARDSDKPVDQTFYQSAVGCLLYLSTRTRPDLAFAVSNVAKYCSNPTEEHWTAVKRILRYVKGTKDLGLLYGNNESRECIGYSDADWGGDSDDRRSTSGFLFEIGGTAVTWRSKKQSCVALSTAEAEYMALTGAAQEAVWLRELATELGAEPTKPTVIHEDNQSTIHMARNPQFHGRTKHIGIKYHYIREQVNNQRVELLPNREHDS